jgi:hypothetical protein
MESNESIKKISDVTKIINYDFILKISKQDKFLLIFFKNFIFNPNF